MKSDIVTLNDSKEYDIRSFNSHVDSSKYLIKYFDVRLNEDTAKLLWRS